MLPHSSQNNSFNCTSEIVENLPEYSTGFTIAPLTPQNAITSRLQIKINYQGFSNSFDIGDVVSGKLILSPKCVVKVVRMYIVLSVHEVAKQAGWIVNKYISHVRELSKFVIPLNLSPLITSSGYIYEVPFSFQLPEIVGENPCLHANSDHLRLPPSLGSPPDLNNERNNLENNAARISYRLEAIANIFDDVKKVSHKFASAFDYIHVLPSYTAPEFERNLTESSFYVDGSVSKRDSLLKPSFEEKFKLGFSKVPLIPMTGASIAALSLLLAPSHSVQPPKILEITIKLRAYTHYSAAEPPKVNKFTLLSTKPSSTTVWIKLDACSFQTVFNLPLMLPQKNKLITPSFASCVISRNYELEVSVTMQGFAKSLEICVPVTVVANLTPRSNGWLDPTKSNSNGLENNFDKLPDYNSVTSSNFGSTGIEARELLG
jgi:hypothetical protein